MDAVDHVEIVSRGFNFEEDSKVIYATWRNSWFYNTTLRYEKDSKEVFKRLTKTIKEILKDADVKIACFKDDPEIIVGYSVVTNKHLHFVYVKEVFRKQGIATMLVPKDIETVTPHLTKLGKIILEKKLKENENGREESDQKESAGHEGSDRGGDPRETSDLAIQDTISTQ